MIPPKHRRILIADTQRAQSWEAGLKSEGIEALRIEATGRDAEKGSYLIVVPQADELRAKAFVAAVLNGKRKLPHALPLPSWGLKALIGALLTVALVVALIWLGHA